jgi:hypothetical protein
MEQMQPQADAALRRLLRELERGPLDVAEAAHVLGCDYGEARRVLDLYTRQDVVRIVGPGRYALAEGVEVSVHV